jgi:ABC-type transport system involved in cytochrome bd biosynthesis fused ATPase/permease subunit
LTPLFPVLVATVLFWWRQRWKLRARDESFKSKVWQNALASLSHEATSAANAIRANLTGFRLAHPQASQSELLNAMERATARIDKAVQKSNGLLPSKGKAN